MNFGRMRAGRLSNTYFMGLRVCRQSIWIERAFVGHDKVVFGMIQGPMSTFSMRLMSKIPFFTAVWRGNVIVKGQAQSV